MKQLIVLALLAFACQGCVYYGPSPDWSDTYIPTAYIGVQPSVDFYAFEDSATKGDEYKGDFIASGVALVYGYDLPPLVKDGYGLGVDLTVGYAQGNNIDLDSVTGIQFDYREFSAMLNLHMNFGSGNLTVQPMLGAGLGVPQLRIEEIKPNYVTQAVFRAQIGIGLRYKPGKSHSLELNVIRHINGDFDMYDFGMDDTSLAMGGVEVSLGYRYSFAD